MSINDKNEGEKIRRQVMGPSFVDKELSNASEFDMPLQEAAMEHAWGGVWTRGVLDYKQRSMITLSMLIALRAHGELQGHIRGALNNGVSEEEIREVIMHSAAYCGYPAALSAIKVAREVIDNKS